VHWLFALFATWIATSPPGAVTALALRDGRLLAGTVQGLFQAGAAGWQRTPVSGAVLDLAAGPDALWIATSRGLWSWAPGAEPIPALLGAGARLRGVAVDTAGSVWVASESGLFVRRSGTSAFERDATLPPGDVAGLRAAGTALFAARSGVLWVRRQDRFEVLASGLGDGWWQLRAAVAWRGSVYLAAPRGLWRVDAEGAERIELALGEVRDLHADASGLWVASARGLWRYMEPPGLLDGEAGSELDANVTRVLAAGERLLAATDRGVAELAAHEPPAHEPARAPSDPAAPDVAAVHAAALAYLDLAPEQLRRVEQLARRRGWLPLLRAGASGGSDRERDRDRDEVFTSGEQRSLFDTHYARDRGIDGDLEIVWDFTRLADPDDALAVSRERRLVIELRDQVLERVNRLYFERLRARDALLAAGGDEARRREHELRVAELTAQLDAWTGGRFSRLLHGSPPIDRRQP
jgi:hypothetical protein